jgi:hypothetical protein
MAGQLAEPSGGRHRLLHLAQSSTTRRPTTGRWPPAWPRGTRWSHWWGSWVRRERHLRGRRRRHVLPRPRRAGAHPGRMQGAGRPTVCPSPSAWWPPGAPVTSSTSSTTRRRRRPGHRPDPLPGHLGPALTQDEAALRPDPVLARAAGPPAEPSSWRDPGRPRARRAVRRRRRQRRLRRSGRGWAPRPAPRTSRASGLPSTDCRPIPRWPTWPDSKGVHPAEVMIDLCVQSGGTSCSSSPASTPRTKRCCCGRCATRGPS